MANSAEKEIELFIHHYLETCADAAMDEETHEMVSDVLGDFPAVEDVTSFSEGMVLTNNAGMIVKLANGTRFTISIIQQ